MKDMQHRTETVLSEIEGLLARATQSLRDLLAPDGRVDAQALEQHQHAAHALSWLATYVESLKQLHAWTDRASGPMDRLIAQIGFGEYLTQIAHGLPMSQT
ncbi:MAG: acyl-CoA dehydrogenase, partial [Paracoccus sp. (in: a-proteobacteria)]|nr:acyl-CoA dehydrogenase [Paracoccus sp. (in: a-proteobacteria)]